MVGILLSYWGGLFSGATLVSGRVKLTNFFNENLPPWCAPSSWQAETARTSPEPVAHPAVPFETKLEHKRRQRAATLETFHNLPGTSLSSIFGLQPSKTRPFPTKARVIWVPGESMNFNEFQNASPHELWLPQIQLLRLGIFFRLPCVVRPPVRIIPDLKISFLARSRVLLTKHKKSV